MSTRPGARSGRRELRIVPVSWEEIEQGVEIGDFTLRNARARIERVGDLWRPLLRARGRFTLDDHLPGERL